MDQAIAYPAPHLLHVRILLALALGWACPQGHAAWKGGVVKQAAVFSTGQLLWPALGQGEPEKSPDSTALGPKPRIAVVPVTVREFVEKSSCDSCDRLSPNVLEFFLPSWHRELLARWTGKEVEVLSSGNPLLGADTAWISHGASFGFPWRAWFDTLEQVLIYRHRDRFTSPQLIAFCSSLGGRTGMSHLLFIDSVRVTVSPWGRKSHRGSFRFAYMAVLWDVAQGQPEWAIKVATQGPWWTDLNAPLEPRLLPDLERFHQEMPLAVKSLWRKEPQ